MPTFEQVIKQAGDALLAHEIGKQEHVMRLWKHIEWMPCEKSDREVGAELDATQSPSVRLYPSLLKMPKALHAVLREFGLFLVACGGERASNIWEKKLLAPSAEHIELYASKLKDAELRKRCHTYEQLLQSYPNKGHSVERLIAIHFSNALLANNMPYPDSIGVDIHSWGPTAQFAAGKKYYSLIPLSSAYCPGDIHRCPGCAFAALIIDNLHDVRDTSVAAGLRVILRNVIQRSATP
jgi:hypothetical protein